MTHYPTFIYSLSNGYVVTKPVYFVPPGGEEKRVGLKLCVPGDPYDAFGNLLPNVRTVLICLGREERLTSGLPVCAVFGPNDCAYIEEDHFRESDSPPRLGEQVTDDCEPEVLAEILAELTKNEVDTGTRPILPAKRNDLVF
mgnify:FL=1